MTTQLTEAQLNRIHEICWVGTRLVNALRVIGLHGRELDEALNDRTVQDVAGRARAEGAYAVRERLKEQADLGNVSAARTLALHKDEDAEQEAPKAKFNEVEWQRLMKRIRQSADEAFERQRRLLEEAEADGLE
jgi:hypothetical protein